MGTFLKILSSALVLVFIFCGISANATEYKNSKDWDNATGEYDGQFLYSGGLPPSFNCQVGEKRRLTIDERAVCQDSYYLPAMDNLFSSCYTFIMRNVEKEDKGVVRDIAKSTLKRRGGCPDNEEYMNMRFGIYDCISMEYEEGIRRLSIFSNVPAPIR